MVSFGDYGYVALDTPENPHPHSQPTINDSNHQKQNILVDVVFLANGCVGGMGLCNS